MVLDANADPEKVTGLLGRLAERIDELERRAFTYKSYQKNFKVSFGVNHIIKSCMHFWNKLTMNISQQDVFPANIPHNFMNGIRFPD